MIGEVKEEGGVSSADEVNSRFISGTVRDRTVSAWAEVVLGTHLL